jgi:hypothetical protein
MPLPTLLIFLASTLAVSAHAAEMATPESITMSIERTCRRFTDQDRVRCKAREERKWRQSLALTRPTGDFEFRDRQDFGQGHLRKRLVTERRFKFRESVQETRRTYRQMKPVDDVNTRRRSYLNDLRLGRLRCMLEDPGRPRSLCMDRIGNWSREQMQRTSGTRQYPAQ